MKVSLTDEIKNAIKARFCQPEWATFFEVPNSTGGADRRMDAFSMNMYRSKGFAIQGFEVKISRSDLLRELKDPSKSEALGQYCDFWYLAVPKGLIKEDDQIPEFWGIYEYENGILKIKKKAIKLDPKTVTRPFVAALLRKPEEEFNNAVSQRVREHEKKRDEEFPKCVETAVARELEYRKQRWERELDIIETIKEAMGGDFFRYIEKDDCLRLVKLNNYIKENGYGTIGKLMDDMRETADKISNVIQGVSPDSN